MGKYRQDKNLKDASTGWVVQPCDSSLDDKVVTDKSAATIPGEPAPAPSPDYASQGSPAKRDFSTTTLILYRRSVGFCRAHKEGVGAAIAVTATVGILALAGYNTEWFGLAEDRPARKIEPKAVYDRGAVTDDGGVDCEAVYRGEKVNPLWERICGPLDDAKTKTKPAAKPKVRKSKRFFRVQDR